MRGHHTQPPTSPPNVSDHIAVSEAGMYAARSQATAGTIRAPAPDFDREGFVDGLVRAAARRVSAAAAPRMPAKAQSLDLAFRGGRVWRDER